MQARWTKLYMGLYNPIPKVPTINQWAPNGLHLGRKGEKKIFFFKNRKKKKKKFSKNRPGRKQDPRPLGPGGYDRGPTHLQNPPRLYPGRAYSWGT